MYNKPIKLCAERAWRTYLGGKLIEKLHGNIGACDTNFPEEWLMSVVRAKNPGREDIVEGLSRTEDGRFLKDIISEAPETILGISHYQKYGSELGVLVKILDAGERLGIQVHPTREKAKKYFDSEFGKTECWHIIDCREDSAQEPCVYIGFKEGITREKWEKCFYEQNILEMISCLNRVPVKIGDTILVRGGVPHAIGEGCLLVEIQEPTDYTLRTERTAIMGDNWESRCHYGIGFDAMFDCFEYDGLSIDDEIKKSGIKPVKTEYDGYSVSEILKYSDTPMFKMELIEVKTSCVIEKYEAFSGMYILEGEGFVAGDDAGKGAQFFLPASCDGFEIKNSGSKPMKIMRYYGPEI